jgi:hypothetical protein
MMLFGGSFMMLISCVEAYRICGWETTKKGFAALYKNFSNVKEGVFCCPPAPPAGRPRSPHSSGIAFAASEKDDTVDAVQRAAGTLVRCGR